MTDESQSKTGRLPLWVLVISTLASVTALVGLLVLRGLREPTSSTITGWVLFLAGAIPLYLIVNVIAGASLEALAASHKWLGPILAILIVVAFYIHWFWQLFEQPGR